MKRKSTFLLARESRHSVEPLRACLILVAAFSWVSSDAAALVNVGTIDTPGDAKGVEVAGGLAYLADGLSGLRVIDVSVPGAPVELGAIDTPDRAFDVEVVNGLAYVADDASGLRVIDVSDPTAPVELGAIDTPGPFARDVEVVGNLAYLADVRSRVPGGGSASAAPGRSRLARGSPHRAGVQTGAIRLTSGARDGCILVP